MFNLGWTEILLIAVIALVFIGPKQLPDLARALGRFMSELRRSSNSLTAEFREVTDQAGEEFQKARHEIQNSQGQRQGNSSLLVSEETESGPSNSSHQTSTSEAQTKEAKPKKA
ncbi:MAG: Sec-independent protein translocase protein TatB [Bdellovibrio sp.]